VADPPRAALAAASATAAAACTVGGVLAVAVSVVAGPGPGLARYVSEAGVRSSPYASMYRLGILGLAAALLLLAAALPATLRRSAALLAASGTSAVLSAAVACSDRCPLPPFQRATVADLLHGGASIAAVAGCVFAMLALAVSPDVSRPLRWLAVTATSVALPLSATVGVAMLMVGRGAVVGLVERVLLADLALWVLASALTIGFAHAAAGGRMRSPPGDATPPTDPR
jgi:hypothetical protein